MLISSTILRTALVDYRAELLRLSRRYPQTYKSADSSIHAIDSLLLSIEGNITNVAIYPATCNMHG